MSNVHAMRPIGKTITEVAPDYSIANGGGGGDSGGMEARVTRLETHFQYIQRDLADLKAGQKEISAGVQGLNDRLAELKQLPTKDDLWSWKIQWTGICVAAIVLIVGGIIGGLDWIKVH